MIDRKNNKITYTVTKEILGGVETFLKLGGVRNPRTMQETMKFVIETFDSKGTQIDKGYNASTTMTIANSISELNVSSGSELNGAITSLSWSMSIETSVLKNGDQISFKLPPDIRVPTNTTPVCRATSPNVLQISCTAVENFLYVTFVEFKSEIETGTFTWVIDGIRNPVSTKPSGDFLSIQIKDEKNYVALIYDKKMEPIQTT